MTLGRKKHHGDVFISTLHGRSGVHVDLKVVFCMFFLGGQEA